MLIFKSLNSNSMIYIDTEKFWGPRITWTLENKVISYSKRY